MPRYGYSPDPTKHNVILPAHKNPGPAGKKVVDDIRMCASKTCENLFTAHAEDQKYCCIPCKTAERQRRKKKSRKLRGVFNRGAK